MTTKQFDSIVAPNINALSVIAIDAASTAQLASLTSAQSAAITTTQYNSLTATQQGALPFMPAPDSNVVLQAVATQESNGSILYDGVLAVLQQFDTSSVTTTVWNGLETFASEVDSGAISASAYVQQMLDNVVEGSSANATWTGGEDTMNATYKASTTLGNLAAGSSSQQFSELVSKWFLGTDNPFDNGVKYQDYSSNPLFGANGPLYSDITQGAAGDCYFLAGLASTAQNDPSLIKNMIQSNGNGTYSVDFKVNGKDTYVTVDSQFATNGEYGLYNARVGSDNSLWVPLIEKAYVELSQLTEVKHAVAGHNNDYAQVYGGCDDGLAAITGHESTAYYLSSSNAVATAKALATAVANKDEIMLVSNDDTNGWVKPHMYAVTGYDAKTNNITVYNPWGAGAGAYETMTMSLSKVPISDSIYIMDGTAAKA